MFNAARVLPAGPGEPDVDVFPLRERLRFRDNFGLGLRDVRQRPAFAALAKGPWALFIAIAVHWQGNAEAWPSQETLARFSGWSSRAVRDQALTLERGGFVRLRRERRGDGSERIFYAPGPVTLLELAAFVERFPRERAKTLQPEAPAQVAGPLTPTPPPEAASAAPPEGASMELRDQDQKEPSSCEAPSAAPPIAEEQQGDVPSAEDTEVARVALGERMRRKHPTRPSPRWFDAGELAMVAACSAAIEGDREAKLAAHREALTGAFAASKDGPPTVRFTWGTLEHFLDHVERGRRLLRAEELERRHRQRAASPAPRVQRAPAPAIPLEQMQADLARLFGPSWKPSGGPS
jgi:hypothetical protein